MSKQKQLELHNLLQKLNQEPKESILNPEPPPSTSTKIAMELRLCSFHEDTFQRYRLVEHGVTSPEMWTRLVLEEMCFHCSYSSPWMTLFAHIEGTAAWQTRKLHEQGQDFRGLLTQAAVNKK